MIQTQKNIPRTVRSLDSILDFPHRREIKNKLRSLSKLFADGLAFAVNEIEVLQLALESFRIAVFIGIILTRFHA